MSKNPLEPFRTVFDLALDRLLISLKEAQSYLAAGNDLAAIGTLHNLDELHADIQAALRLFRSRRFEQSD